MRTKKARTLLAAFSGSIGIIGIALILSFSNGVNNYISDIQKETMTSYPITIEEQSIDMSSIMGNTGMPAQKEELNPELNAVYSNGRNLEMVSTMATSISENNLTPFKKYLDNKDSEINKYIGDDEAELKNLINSAVKINISAVIKPKEDVTNRLINSPIAYTNALTNYIINYTDNSEVVKAQEESKSINLAIYSNYISPGSYDDNMSTFGVVSLDAPAKINIYTDSFEDKEAISKCIDNYNNTVEEGDKITYTDYVALLMLSVTTIINVISYVLIAFVSVSLVVSSIMIGIITYISVLERTKEIGILRAIGASKNNISQVFNAETFILLYIHRWDYETSIEETMCALNDLVRSGKVLYLGVSSMYAWQFAKAQYVAEKNR